jgi:hypothetical protein
VDTLERFSRVHGISYPLLSDEGSATIIDLGVLNVTVEAERAAYNRPMEDRHRGIPYPGTFFLDEAGVLVDKRFEQSHRIRPTGVTLLKQLLGDDSMEPAVSAEAASPGVRVAAWLDTDVIHANQLQDLHVRIEMDDDIHLYVDPVPAGFNALSIAVSGDDRLRADPAHIAPGRPFAIEGLTERFFVVEGQVETTVPFTLLSNRDTAGDAIRPVAIDVLVSYQACTSTECFMPERTSLRLDLSEHPNPGYETSDATAVSPLALRRIVEQPRSDEELLDLVNAALAGTAVSSEMLAEVLDDLTSGGFIHRSDTDEWTLTDGE